MTSKLTFCEQADRFILPLHIEGKHPFPVVFGSETVSGKALTGMYGRPGERYVDRSLILGDDIQHAFVPKSKIQTVHSILNPLGVKVYDIDRLTPQQKPNIQFYCV